VGRDEVVRGSVSAIGGDVTVDGHVEGDVSAIRGDVYLGASARVDGDVVSAGGQIHEEPGAIVGGQRVTAIPGSRLKRIHRQAQEETGEHVAGVMAAMVWLIIMLGMGWAIAQLAPARTVAAVETLQRAPLLSFGIGAMILALIIPSLIALSLVVAFLCITIIGIPLALAALLGYGLFFAVFGIWGYVVGAGAIGSLILRRRAALATAPGAVVDHGSPAGISRAVVAGVLVMTGSLVFGSLLHSSPMLGPLRVLGGLAFILSIITMALSSLAGGGAWLRSEFQTGTLGRWWHRRKLPAVKPAGSAAAPAPPTPPAPPAAPAPPSSYAPPAAPGPEAPPSPYAPPPADPPAPPPTG
jgi:hypothetical protein